MMVLSTEILLLFFMIAAVAGFIDSIAGGGGLLTIPSLLALGLPPTLALGTNKLQSCGGSFSASLYFIRKKAVNLRQIWLLILMAFIGAAIGTISVQNVDTSVLKKILPLLTLSIGLYFLFSPQLGKIEQQKKISYPLFAFTFAFAIGWYDGFFGMGTGSLLSLVFITLLGFNLTKAVAHAKVLNFTSNITALAFFILADQVLWTLGLTMLAGQFIGAQLGARLVLTKGQTLIRSMVVVMSLLITAKMMFD